MTGNSEKERHNVWINKKIYQKFIEKHGKGRFSQFVESMLEAEVYDDNPEKLRQKMEERTKKYHYEMDLDKAKLKVAEENQQTKKERLKTTLPEAIDYRTLTPSKKGVK